MIRIWLTAALAATVFASSASASVLVDRLAGANGANLFAEDDSREMIIDVDNNGRINKGDVIIGFVQIDQTSPPPAAAANQLYGIFSQQFAADPLDLIVDSPDLLRLYTGSFEATTVAGLTLKDLLGPTLSASVTTNDGMLAVLERTGGFSQDLILALPSAITDRNGDTVIDPFDYIDLLTDEATLDLVAGISAGDDFFRYTTAITGAAVDPFASIANFSLYGSSVTLGTFEGALTILEHYLGPTVTFNEVIPASDLTLHDLVVSGGTFSGANNIQVENPDHPNGPFTVIDNADITINATVVPEPASMLAWVGLGGAFFVVRRRHYVK